MAWNGYIDNILHEHEKSENADDWKKKDCSFAAAILDRNGNVQGSSSKWKKFSSSNIECATADGMGSEKVKVDELASLLAYVAGEDKPKPAGAVVLMGGKKYKHLKPREEFGDIYGDIPSM